MGNYGQLKSMLVQSGIRHIRDGLPNGDYGGLYWDFNDLANNGIRETMLTNIGQGYGFLSSIKQSLWGIEAFEGPNEYDTSGDWNWAGTLGNFMWSLNGAVHSNSVNNGVSIIAPSATSADAYAQMASFGAASDYGNMHDYLSGFYPGTPGWGPTNQFGTYATISYNMNQSRQSTGNKPIIATETGYGTNDWVHSNIPAGIESRYTLRLYLEQYRQGVARTFQYEFMQEGSDMFAGYGLLSNAYSPKPAYYAVKNLIGTLADPGNWFQPGSLNYQLSGNTNNVHHVLLQKRDGSFYLVLWIEASSYNVDANGGSGATVWNAPQNVTVNLGSQPSSASVVAIDDNGNANTTWLSPSTNLNLNVTDNVQILKIVPGNGSSVSAPAPPTGTSGGTSGGTSPTGAAALFPLDESYGNMAWDQSGNNNNITENGGYSHVWGRNSDALKLDGWSGYGDVNRAIVNTTQSYTLSAWVNLLDFGKWNTAVSLEGSHMSACFLQFDPGSKKWAFTTTNGDWSGASVTRVEGGSPSYGTWTHLAGVYDAGAHTMALYVNGSYAGSTSFNGAWPGYAKTAIGRALWNDAKVDYWSGTLDNVQFFQRALSASDVAGLAAQ